MRNHRIVCGLSTRLVKINSAKILTVLIPKPVSADKASGPPGIPSGVPGLELIGFISYPALLVAGYSNLRL